MGAWASVQCDVCPSDSADVFFVRDTTGAMVATVLRCKVCGYVSLV